MKMFLYVWTDVLSDWSSGLAVALAPNLGSALAQFPEDVRRELRKDKPKVFLTERENPLGFYVHGGS